MDFKSNPKNYRFIWPKITKDTKNAVLNQLNKGEISIYDNSGIFSEFENRFKNYIGTNHALTFSSGTAGLHAALVACDLQENDEVLCQAYTFYASITPLFQLRGIPVLFDLDNQFSVNLDIIKQKITPKTKALIVTHMWGYPIDLKEISSFCKSNNIILIEDCSHAHGASINNKKVGSLGDVSVFSLQGQKIITGGEGGILLTNSKEIFERALLFGHYNKRCKQEISKDSKYFPYSITGMGLKLRAHPFAIAMANQQLTHINEWIKNKNINAKYLTDKLSKLFGDKIYLNNNINCIPSYYAFTVTIKINIDPNKFEQIVEEIKSLGLYDIDLPKSTCPLNLLYLFQNPEIIHPWYKNKIKYKPKDFPNSEKFFYNTFKVPIDVELSKKYNLVLDFYAKTIFNVLSKYI